ncbi:MAG: flagellar protein export ATPase FliI [Alphaproteobacteria bacterium]|nr:MAG: flagellar protein export ATPase FliI [Alphaproteobacteria bacterium]
MPDLERQLADLPLANPYGRVTAVEGLVVRVAGLGQQATMGGKCRINDIKGEPNGRMAEVVGSTDDGTTLVMPYGPLDGIGAGQRVHMAGSSGGATVQVNHSWIGRVLNGLGEPLDGKGPLASVGGEERALRAGPPPAFQRQMVGAKMDTGVRVLNTLLPLCEGQRLGIFAGSGVGKSVLMGMLTKYSDAEVTVIGLIGERGKELNEFIAEQLGPEGLARSIVITATGDEPPLVRRQAAYLTMAAAEYFRDCGFKVLLLMDSVTRLAQAQREIGLASREPPTTRGYTPSVFAELPRLLERAGPGTGKGCISAIFTVLVEGGDMEEPVADAVRGILDGHIVLTRSLAERGHFPAIDVLQSVSRTVPKCLTTEEYALVRRCRQVLATYDDMAELIRLGAYTAGSDPAVDEAIRLMPKIEAFLRQHPEEVCNMPNSYRLLAEALQG